MNPFYQDPLATPYQGHVLDVLAQLPAESVNCVVTSPPYWGLRKYQGEQDRLWDNHNGCEHEWEIEQIAVCNHNGTGATSLTGGKGIATQGGGGGSVDRSTCLKCGAWRGAYGLEPTIALYVQHTITILHAIRRMLRKDGVVWWNVGDSYSGSGKGGNPVDSPWAGFVGNQGREQASTKGLCGMVTDGLKPKDLCLIPSRVALAAQDDGWWVRSMIVWSKRRQ